MFQFMLSLAFVNLQL